MDSGGDYDEAAVLVLDGALCDDAPLDEDGAAAGELSGDELGELVLADELDDESEVVALSDDDDVDRLSLR